MKGATVMKEHKNVMKEHKNVMKEHKNVMKEHKNVPEVYEALGLFIEKMDKEVNDRKITSADMVFLANLEAKAFHEKQVQWYLQNKGEYDSYENYLEQLLLEKEKRVNLCNQFISTLCNLYQENRSDVADICVNFLEDGVIPTPTDVGARFVSGYLPYGPTGDRIKVLYDTFAGTLEYSEDNNAWNALEDVQYMHNEDNL